MQRVPSRIWFMKPCAQLNQPCWDFYIISYSWVPIALFSYNLNSFELFINLLCVSDISVLLRTGWQLYKYKGCWICTILIQIHFLTDDLIKKEIQKDNIFTKSARWALVDITVYLWIFLCISVCYYLGRCRTSNSKILSQFFGISLW